MLNAAITQAHTTIGNLNFFQPVDCLPDLPGGQANPNNGADCALAGFDTNVSAGDTDFQTSINNILADLRWFAVVLAVIAIILVGFYIMGNVVGNNSAGAAGNLKKIGWVFVGLVVIFNATVFVGYLIP